MKDSPAHHVPASSAAARPIQVVDPARRKHVLLVDDEAAVRSVLRRFLERRGWVVIEAPNAELALELIDNPANSVDAAVVDMHLPGLAGAALCQRISAARPALATKMVVASGDARTASAALAREQVTCPVLAKPFELVELERVLGDLLSR